MSNILKGIVNEAHYPEDPDEYEAMFGARRKPKRMEPDEPQEPYNPMDDYYKKQDAAQAKYNKEVKVEYSDKEGVAPNGERYNSMFVVRAANPYQGDNEIRKFEDLHWGAKKIVDTVKKEPSNEGEPYITAVYYVDNHKYGTWRPWKDEAPTQKPLTFENPVEQFGKVLEGISQEDLANVLCHRIEMRYPDIYKKYDYDAMYNAVDDVASFHAGAEELGSSDINIMIRQVFKRLEESEGLAEGSKDSQDRIKELKNYIDTKERVLAGGYALSPGEQKALAQARQELKQLKKQGVAEGSGQTEETAVINMFEKLVKQGRDPIDTIAHKFGWGSYELDSLAKNLGFKNSADWANAVRRGEGVNKGVAEDQLDELNWRKGLATGAMALGALGAGSAGAAGWDKNSPEWGSSGLPDHVKTNTQINKSNGGSSLDKQMSSVQGPNQYGEYKVTTVDRTGGKSKVITYVTKNPPKDLMTNEQLDELKCWDGYKRVPGTTAGEPGSCEKIKEGDLNELSTDRLAKYKTASAADARAADKAGDFARGNKRFAGIVKATKKQFDNETKPKKESAIMKGLVDENLGTPYPGTYEQEFGPFKRKGSERTMKLTTEGKKNVSRRT